MANKKLFEILSSAKGKTVTIHEVPLTFDRFTLSKHGAYEADGIAMEDLPELYTKDRKQLIKLIFELLDSDSKKEFENSIETFTSCINLEDLLALAEGFMNTIFDSQFISEKGSSDEKK